MYWLVLDAGVMGDTVIETRPANPERKRVGRTNRCPTANRAASPLLAGYAHGENATAPPPPGWHRAPERRSGTPPRAAARFAGTRQESSVPPQRSDVFHARD